MVINLGGDYLSKVWPLSVITFISVVVILAVWKVSREAKSRKYLAELLDSADEMYFCGLNFKRIIKTRALFRVQNWIGGEMSSWWAPLAMLVLKENPTSVLYQGTSLCNDGTKEIHSWVEFNIPQGDRYVLDFSWLPLGFCERRQFFKMLDKEDDKLTPEWSCDYTTFWSFRWSNILWTLMRKQKTSHILDGLDAYCLEGENNFDFCTIVEELGTEEPKSFGVSTVPWRIENSNKVFSASILQDFVKYPRCKAPRDKTLKRAYRQLREAEAELE